MKKYAAVLLAFSFCNTFAFAEENVTKVVDRLQRSYDKIQSIEAKFEQTYKSSRFGDKKSGGTVVIAKPGKMRWDYDEPKGKVMVANGKSIVLYDPEDRQAMVATQPEKGGMPIALSFLWGEGKLADSFNCTLGKMEEQKKKETTLHCLPKEITPNVAEIVLAITRDDPVLVTATRVRDAVGGENEILFSDIRVNQKVSKSRFKFTPPKGTHFVSLENDGPKPD